MLIVGIVGTTIIALTHLFGESSSESNRDSEPESTGERIPSDGPNPYDSSTYGSSSSNGQTSLGDYL